jgi:FeS assembly SUF system protein
MNMMSVDLVRLVREEAGGDTDSADAPLHDRVVEALREVHDPEIPVNIYDLGLIYRLDVDEVGRVDIDMTLTTPNCPVAESMPNMVLEAVQGVDEVASVNVNLVWDPPWGPGMMSEEARLALDMFG